MGKTNKLTMKRLRARMAAFETVFDVVRLLKENDLDERALANSGARSTKSAALPKRK